MQVNFSVNNRSARSEVSTFYTSLVELCIAVCVAVCECALQCVLHAVCITIAPFGHPRFAWISKMESWRPVIQVLFQNNYFSYYLGTPGYYVH